MIDRDLAELYGVETKVLNQAVKRNIERFPLEFRFQLNTHERNELVTICDRFEKMKYSTINPYAFTEQGISMLSAVLRSKTAIQVSIKIMNTFVQMRKFIATHGAIFQRLEQVEQKQIATDHRVEKIFKAIEDKSIQPKQGIFYDGEVFDAYTFVCNIIKQATVSIILVDNYIDETVLTLFSKRERGVGVTLYTKGSRPFRLDLQRYNQQYPEIVVKELTKSHDRFLIIDNVTVYHIGASLKDLGKKWFAFSKLEMDVEEMLEKLVSNSRGL